MIELPGQIVNESSIDNAFPIVVAFSQGDLKMGRPWWYDSYWQKGRKPGRRSRFPSQRFWAWMALLVLSILLAIFRAEHRMLSTALFAGFVYYLSNLLSLAIFVRVILSWLAVSRYNLGVVLLDHVIEPVLSPLRRVIPLVGRFDITPLVAIIILYLASFFLTALLT